MGETSGVWLLIEVLSGKRLARSVAPYLILGLPNSRFRTKVAKVSDLSYRWNEAFTVELEPETPLNIELELWRKGFAGTCIAKGSVDLSELRDQQIEIEQRWVGLFHRSRGQELSAGVVELRFSLFDDKHALLKAQSESCCSATSTDGSGSGERGLNI